MTSKTAKSDRSQPNNVATKADPTGEVPLYENAGVPALSDDVGKVYDYVDEKAQSIGQKIRKNRGLPPGADPENMLSLEEKAIVILGRAVGVTWMEINERIIRLRLERGETPPNREPYHYQRLLRSHDKIVAAIQTDMLASIEAFSPLVGGSQRFLWRARILEFYRSEVRELHKKLLRLDSTDDTSIEIEMSDGEIKVRNRSWIVDRIKSLDKAMRPHLTWLDQIGEGEALSTMLQNPSDLMRKQEVAKREKEIEEAHEAGEISDMEKAEQLRELRHG